MTNKIHLLFIVFLTLVCGNIVAQTTKTWTASSSYNLNNPITVDENITLTWSENSGDQAPKFSNNYVYFYNGNQVKVTASSNCKIIKIGFSFADEKQSMQILSGDGTYSGSTWSGEASEVSFRAPRQTGVRKITSMEITYKTEGEVVDMKANLNITELSINATADLESTPSVYVKYKNEGNAATENAKATLYVDDVENASAAISQLAVGAETFSTIFYNTANISAGDHQVYVKLTADNADAVQTETKTVSFTKKTVEATFELKAADVEVDYDAEKIGVTVNVKNTSEVDASSVAINLWYNGTIATDTIKTLAAGADTNVIFEFANPFKNAGTYHFQALTGDNKYGCSFNIIIKEAPVVPVIDMEITTISGISEIDLTTENKIQVWYKNNSNVDVENAVITVTLNDTEIAKETVSVQQGKNGNFYVTIPTENLTAGVDATVVATVSVENDTNAENDTFTKIYQVKGAAVPEATFSLTAEDVTVAYDATSYDIVAKVKNTSEVDATNVAVNLVASSIIATDTIESLSAGQEQEVTFTITGGPFTGNQEYQIWIGNGTKGSTSVKVTIEAAPVTPVIDIALIQFSGLSEIDLAAENTIQVWFENNSNVDVENATITLKLNDNEVGSQTIAKNENYKLFTLPTEGLVAGEKATIVATVTVENNINENTSITREYDVVNSGATTETVFELTAQPIEVQLPVEKIDIVVNVKNCSDNDATNVALELWSNGVIATDTIQRLAGGETKDVTFSIEALSAGTYQMQVLTADHKYSCNIHLTVKDTIKTQTIDLAVTDITGTLSLDVESNYLTVYVENMGTMDVTNAVVTLYTGEEELGTDSISLKAGESGIKSFEIATTTLKAEDFSVTAKVTIDDDVDLSNNELGKTFTIVSSLSVKSIKAVTGNERTVIYTLGGKKVNAVQKGSVYIINGKKVIIK